MTAAPQYRFQFQIIDDETGDTVIADFVSLIGTIDEFGGNESIDHAVARMLRQFKQTAREQYERKNYEAVS